jgi:1-acyl-sn-glycerol-3-phosphate acyltransferase
MHAAEVEGHVGSGAPTCAAPHFDPWLSDTAPLTFSELICALLIVLPRFMICAAAAALLGAISCSQLFIASFMSNRTRERWRWSLVMPIRLLARVGLFAAGFYRITCTGERGGANIVVCNHVCCADVLALLWLLGPGFVAKSDASTIPYVGSAARALGCVFVDRSHAGSRASAVAAICARSNEKAEAPLLIFPEGTTTNGLSICQFERGAFMPACAVQPVGISYPHGQRKPDAMFGSDVCLMMMRPWSQMDIHFLRPYHPNPEEARNSALFAANVRAAIAVELGLPLSDFWGKRDGMHRSRLLV